MGNRWKRVWMLSLGVAALAICVAVLVVGIGRLTPRSAIPPVSVPVVDGEKISSPRAGTSGAQRSVQSAAKPSSMSLEASAASVSSATLPARPIRLRATLLPAAGSEPFHGWARIGIAGVAVPSQADTDWTPGQSEEGEKPKWIEGFRNVRQWIEAPVTTHTLGGTVVGPVDVEPARMYRILAWDGHRHYYSQEFFPPSKAPRNGLYDAGLLDPIAATGIRVTLVNDFLREPDYFFFVSRLSRNAATEQNAAVGQLMEWAAPDLADAFSGKLPLVLTLDKPTTLLPLFPDSKVQLNPTTLSGTNGLPTEVDLETGTVTDVVINLADVFSDDAGGFLDLDGRLVNSFDQSPVAAARIVRLGAPVESSDVTDSDGRFHFSTLSRLGIARFLVTTDPRDFSSLRTRKKRIFVFNPLWFDLSDSETSVHVIWVLGGNSALVLDLSQEQQKALQNLNYSGFPRFILEKHKPADDDFQSEGTAGVRSSQNRSGEPEHNTKARMRAFYLDAGGRTQLLRGESRGTDFRSSAPANERIDKTWSWVREEYYTPHRNEVFMPVDHSGYYRIKVLIDPFRAIDTEEVRVEEVNTEVHTSIDLSSLDSLSTCTLVCRRKSDGSPLAFRAIRILSPYSSGVPPMEFVSDTTGRVTLGPVTALQFDVECEGPELLTATVRRSSSNETELSAEMVLFNGSDRVKH